jgi:ABC-type dipeptide/oligopeptide/nickel transport system permease component
MTETHDEAKAARLMRRRQDHPVRRILFLIFMMVISATHVFLCMRAEQARAAAAQAKETQVVVTHASEQQVKTLAEALAAQKILIENQQRTITGYIEVGGIHPAQGELKPAKGAPEVETEK